MLCAQALAVVSGAMAKQASVKVLFNSEDVKRDLLVWAREAGHTVGAGQAGELLIIRHGERGRE